MGVDLNSDWLPCGNMTCTAKACPIVVRRHGQHPEVLAFAHPSAGKQFVKGSIDSGESPLAAAQRELREESGIHAVPHLDFIGTRQIGASKELWYFFHCLMPGLPDAWSHKTEYDFGNTFAFFWHPLNQPLDQDWHSSFHEAFDFFAPLITVD